MIRDAAIRISEAAGDGTTTTILLARTMIDAGLKKVEAGMNPMDIKKGMDKAVKTVTEKLKQMAIPVSTDSTKIEQVASISAGNNPEIGKLIADAMRKAGKEGVITIEEAKGFETYVEVVEGMQFDRGYLSPYFITNPDKMNVVYEKPYILIYDKKISGMKEILPLLDKVSQAITHQLQQCGFSCGIFSFRRFVLSHAALLRTGFAGHLFNGTEHGTAVVEAVFERTNTYRSTQAKRMALHLKRMLHQTGSALLRHRHQGGVVGLRYIHQIAAITKAANRAINDLL